MHHSKHSTTLFILGALAVASIINPNSGLDILFLLLGIYIFLQSFFGDFAILAFLIARPAIDFWRDYNIFSWQNYSININAAISLILFAWAVIFFIRNRDYWHKIPTKLPWILFLIWCAFTFLYSFDRPSTIQETLKASNLFALFAISFVLYQKYKKGFTKKLFVSFFISAIIPLTVAFYQFFTGTGMRIDYIGNRIYGTFAHPNILATFALLLFMVLVEWIKENINKFSARSKENYPIYAGGGLLFLTIILTYTRIAWIGLALFIFLFLLIYHSEWLGKIIVAVLLSYALFFPINSILTNNFNYNLQRYQLIARLTTRSEDADSIQWRTNLIERVMPLFWRKPIFGYGYGSFAKVWDENKSLANLWDTTSEAHNDYLKVGFESGFIGLGLYLTIFLSLFLRQIKFGVYKDWKNIVFIASICVYLILNLSDNMLHHTPMIWWMWAMWGLWSAQYSLDDK